MTVDFGKIVSAFFVVVSLLLAVEFFNNKITSIKFTSRLLGILLLFYSAIFVVRIILVFKGFQSDGFFESYVMQTTIFIISIHFGEDSFEGNIMTYNSSILVTANFKHVCRMYLYRKWRENVK